MRPVLLYLACAVFAAPAQAFEMHCLGREPAFMLVLNDETARFDYLGDGVFDLSPPLAAPLENFTRTELSTAGGPIPVFIERRACQAFGILLPFSVELGIPAFAGQAPAIGCCRQIDPAE